MAEFVKALSDLMWPLLAGATLWLLRPLLANLVTAKTLKIKVGGYELSLDEASASIGAGLSDVQARLATISERLDALAGDGPTAKLARDEGPAPRPPHKRVLWVDDYPANNAFLIARLQASGHPVDVSTSTADALNKLASQAYGLVISDLGRVEDGVNRPMAGLDLVKALRDVDNPIPILIYASARAMALSDQLLAAGATAVSSSGIDVITFVDTHATGP